MSNLELPIHNLARHPGLTPATAEYYTEGARVCLDRHHRPPVEVQIAEGEGQTVAIVAWEPVDELVKGAWANETDTTEAGAYACVLAAVELRYGMVAVRRAETRTGADYYIALRDTWAGDLENLIRLEVSGVDRGTPAAVARRLNDKLEQAARGNSSLPAIAGVVGFRARLIRLAHLEE